MDTEEPITARSRNKISADEVWLLTRPDSDSKRVLFNSESQTSLRLIEEGYIH